MGTSILEANCTCNMTYVLSDRVHTSYISKAKQKNEEWKEAKGSGTHVRVAETQLGLFRKVEGSRELRGMRKEGLLR